MKFNASLTSVSPAIAREHRGDEMNNRKWEKMTDRQRWEWVIANQALGIVVMLDNDQTFVVTPDEDGEWGDSLDFDDYLGWSDGVIAVLELLGVKSESV